MTNKEYIEENMLSFSRVLRMWDNDGHLEDWLNKEYKYTPRFKAGDIIYNKYSNLTRKILFVGDKYYTADNFAETDMTAYQRGNYCLLIPLDRSLNEFICNRSKTFRYGTFAEYDEEYEKIGIATDASNCS